MRVENLSKPIVLSPVQHLTSVGTIKSLDTFDDATSYFYPSMVFPTKVELVSATILYKNKKGDGDKSIKISIQKEKSTIMLTEDKYILKHPEDKLVSTIEYKTPIVLDALQPFYFHESFKMEDSILVIGYRNIQ